MQFLDSNSRLKAARSSRIMRAAVDDPFAWRDAAAFSISASADNTIRRIGCSLLRHAPIALHVDGHWDSELLVAAVVTIPWLRELRLRAWLSIRPQALNVMLVHPTLLQLRVLCLPFLGVDSTTLRLLIARLERLQSLSLGFRQESD